ncbi:flocculation protein FLO11-like [Pomacea canaliculata]|uniref:flocculation protein FLO11-like n=1 Tax=Pomacea canaliculata TaxID=400727 RepID=UPI000D73A653|nr:flocculation protein FLO11-like [Pomacea canaliculata]
MSGNLVSVTAVAVEKSATTQPMQQVSVVTPRASSTYDAEQNSIPSFIKITNDFSNSLLSSNTFHLPLTETSLLSANLVSASAEKVALSSMNPFGSSKYSIERNSLEDFTKVTNAFSDSLLSSITFHVPFNDIITSTPTLNTVWSVPLSAQTVRELPTITSFPSSSLDYAAMSKSSYDSSQTVQLSSGVYSTTNLGGATVASSSVLTPSPASTYISSLATWTTQANMDYQVRSQAVSSGISVASSTGTGAIFSTLAPVLRSTGVAEVLPGSETSFTSITPQSSSRVTQADSVTSSFGSTAGAVVSAASINPSSTLSPSSVQPSGVTLVMTSSKTSNTGNWASCSGGQVSCGSSSSELGKTSLTTSLLSTSSAAAPSTRLSAAASEAAQRTTAAAQSTAQSTPLSPSASFIDASTARSDSTTVFASSASAFNNTPSSTNSLTNKGGKTALVSLSQLLILLAVNVCSAVIYCSY